jgi:hypothetical protein
MLRCKVTGNPCGSDTWMVGHPCQCSECQKYIAFKDKLEIIHLMGQPGKVETSHTTQVVLYGLLGANIVMATTILIMIWWILI